MAFEDPEWILSRDLHLFFEDPLLCRLMVPIVAFLFFGTQLSSLCANNTRPVVNRETFLWCCIGVRYTTNELRIFLRGARLIERRFGF